MESWRAACLLLVLLIDSCKLIGIWGFYCEDCLHIGFARCARSRIARLQNVAYPLYIWLIDSCKLIGIWGFYCEDCLHIGFARCARSRTPAY